MLDTNGETALRNYFRSGGAYVGVHAASTCLVNNTNYQQAVGAIFDYHPELQPAVSRSRPSRHLLTLRNRKLEDHRSKLMLQTFTRQNTTHPATVNVPDSWRYVGHHYHRGY